MKSVIIAGGVINEYEYIKQYAQGCYVICCDGGARHALKMGITPSILMGDFDSIDDEARKYCINCGSEIISYPPEKNATDSQLAMEYAIGLGSNEITFLGATGGRLDHFLANINVLSIPARRGIRARIVDEDNIVYALASYSRISLNAVDGTITSLLPLTTTVTGVTTYGLYYPLSDAVLSVGSSLGVSNVIADQEATVSIKEGCLIVTQTSCN